MEFYRVSNVRGMKQNAHSGVSLYSYCVGNFVYARFHLDEVHLLSLLIIHMVHTIFANVSLVKIQMKFSLKLALLMMV
jgi:hypothetical protein